MGHGGRRVLGGRERRRRRQWCKTLKNRHDKRKPADCLVLGARLACSCFVVKLLLAVDLVWSGQPKVRSWTRPLSQSFQAAAVQETAPPQSASAPGSAVTAPRKQTHHHVFKLATVDRIDRRLALEGCEIVGRRLPRRLGRRGVGRLRRPPPRVVLGLADEVAVLRGGQGGEGGFRGGGVQEERSRAAKQRERAGAVRT
jgi:hypothetical protein